MRDGEDSGEGALPTGRDEREEETPSGVWLCAGWSQPRSRCGASSKALKPSVPLFNWPLALWVRGLCLAHGRAWVGTRG